ncbi:MFS transporter [Spirochaeta africana]|uniref:Arabinose efflux permease family protein n=1 Tax=Spirochaeta africana (strain ATCC 700263 / DSM 8902 / Z-7692) TaxID=889378 RepID=H9UFH5_SPIAZ|nr:MFS transporter [Spirochaeta africana]AFG36268.1 arabinose efflux permease family protein [Spirochaeta africana DSM 8902]
MQKQHAIPITLFFLAGAMFAGVSGNESFNLLPKHFALQGIHPAVTGFIMSFTGIGGIVVLPFLAFFVDHFRAKDILTVAVLLNILVPLIYFLPVPAAELYAVPRALQGSLFGIMMVGFNAALGHSLPPGNRSRGFALFGLMGQAGGLTAIAVGELIFDAGGLSRLYLFSFLLFSCSLLLVRLFPEEKHQQHATDPRLRDFVEVLGRRSMLPPLFWIFILGSGFGTMLAFLPDLVLERNLAMVRPFYIAYPITVAAIRISLSQYFDRFPLYRVLLLPVAMIPLSMLAVNAAQSIVLLAVAGICYGIAHGVMFPTLMGHLMDRSPVHFRGRMSLVFNLMFSFGLFVAGNIGRLFIDESVQGAFTGMAVISSLGLLLLLGVWLRAACTETGDRV